MFYYFYNLKQIFTQRHFKGWGRKKVGKFAQICHRLFGGDLTLLEDGFIRSLGLGIEGSPAFSRVKDKQGIYYDATTPSDLETLLNTYDFKTNLNLLNQAQEAIDFIVRYEISKYNHSPKVPQDFFTTKAPKVLIIAQTFGDSSLKFGFGEKFSTSEILQTALRENPNCEIYLKIHPDVLSGAKKSDFSPQEIPPQIQVITQDFNPISLLKHFKKVYTKTSQMGFEALLVGCECVCFGIPFYAGWGLTTDKLSCPRRTKKLSLKEVFAGAYLLYCEYYNPIFERKSDIFDTLKTIHRYNSIKTNKKAFLFGFSYWKHTFIPPFMPDFKPQNLIFINPLPSQNPLELALKKGLNQDCEIFIWGKRDFDEIETYAKSNAIPLIRVEDGFIRSLGLGSDLTRPYSQVFDDSGIYFDPTSPSQLENILQNTPFDEDFYQDLKQEARELKTLILESKISKYNSDTHTHLCLPQDKLKILVPGQVEDDASIRFGANNMTNLALLKATRESNPNAYILYKPHPDVLSGNRIGNIPQSLALQYCDEICENISLASVLSAVDEVHTMTSLSGFEALLYGKKVVTYGIPFYAGWGLTKDRLSCPRRTRKLSLEELIIGVYILYPRYIHPDTLQICHPSVLIKAIQRKKTRLQEDKIYALKQKTYSQISRFLQRFFKIFKFK